MRHPIRECHFYMKNPEKRDLLDFIIVSAAFHKAALKKL